MKHRYLLLLEVILFEDEEMLTLLTGKSNYQFLYVRTHFENESYFSGRDIGIDQQNYSAQLSYFHSAGFSAGLGSIWYSQFNPRLYATSLMLGYSGKFGKSNDYRYRSSYNRYFFSKMDSVDSHAFNNAFAVGATIDKGFIGTRLDLEIGYNINLPNSMLTDDKLPMTAYFNVSLGYIFSLN